MDYKYLGDKLTDQSLKNKPILLSSTSNAIEPVVNSKANQNNKTETVVPDVKGMSLKKALYSINKSGLESIFSGSGTVVWQSPNPGTVSTIGTVCSIGLK